MYKTIRSTTLRSNLSEVLAAAEKGEKYLVTKKGRPIAGIVDLGLFEDFLALTSPKYLKSIKEAREQVKKGQVYSHEEVFKDIE